MKQKQATEKFCRILNELTDEICDVLSSYDIAICNTPRILEEEYSDQIYHTEIVIYEDFSAIVFQFKKEGLTDTDPPDPYCPFRTIEDLPEEKIWDLSKYEVLKCLTKSIFLTLEEYLSKMKDGIVKLQKLGMANSTMIEAMGILQILYKAGESIYTKYSYNTQRVLCLEDMVIFVNDFKDYLYIFSDYDVLRRFHEFSTRMPFEATEIEPKSCLDEISKQNKLILTNALGNNIKKTKTHWVLTFNGKESYLESILEGLIALEILLTNPGKTYLAGALRAEIKRYSAGHIEAYRENKAELTLEYSQPDDDTSRFLINKTAQKMIEGDPEIVRNTIEKLKDDLENTDDPVKKNKIQAQIRTLSSSLTKNGLSRTFNSDADRKALERYFKTIKEKIKPQNQLLYDHFESYLKIGSSCSYRDTQRIWEISQKMK